MLIHIESYIRQLLLPTFRQPRYIGLVRVLFEPLKYVLNKHNDFEREAIFRAGLTGQKLLLEYYLRTTVEGSIYLEDRDGVKLDFVVIIPQNLSAVDRKKVFDIVSAYKLASKRFALQDVFFTSAPPQPSNLAWTSGYPSIDGTTGIALAVTIAGTYRTRIRAQGQSSYLKDEMVGYLANQAQVTTVATGYIYNIEVEALTATLDLTAPPQRICDLTFEFDRPGGGWLVVAPVNGLRRVSAYLYSAYSNLAPFVFRMFNYDTLAGTVGSLVYEKTDVQNPQPLTVDLPNTVAVSGGTYAVRFLDKDGCATPIVATGIPAVGGSNTCTIAWDDSAGANTAVTVTTVGQQYQVMVKVALAQTGAKAVTVKKASDDTLIASGGFSGITYIFFLPNGTTQQSIKVEVTEGVGCTTGVRTISLPALPGLGEISQISTGGIEIQQNVDGTWSVVNTPMSVAMSRPKTFAYDGSINLGTETSNWIGYILINDVPLKNGSNQRRDFANISLPAGQLISVRVIWLEAGYYNSWSVVKGGFWQLREPRINQGEAYAPYHPWKFWKQAQALIKT